MKMREETNGTADNGSVTVFPAADRIMPVTVTPVRAGDASRKRR